MQSNKQLLCLLFPPLTVEVEETTIQSSGYSADFNEIEY